MSSGWKGKIEVEDNRRVTCLQSLGFEWTSVQSPYFLFSKRNMPMPARLLCEVMKQHRTSNHHMIITVEIHLQIRLVEKLNLTSDFLFSNNFRYKN